MIYMLKIARSRLIGLAAILFFLVGSASAANLPEVEVLHWWSSLGEKAAFDVFTDAYKARNGRIFDSRAADQTSNRESAIARMSKGIPATLTQWNAGRDIREFYKLGLIDPITDVKLAKKLKNTLWPTVLDAVSHNEDIIAMPVSVHSENWMWYNPGIIKPQESLLPGNWEKLLEHGANLGAENLPLLAIGSQRWQVRILFTSLFLGISREAYRKFYLNTDASVVDSEEFRRVLDLFSKLSRYSKSFGDGSWSAQVQAVANSSAGATFMGDWAKGEFESLGSTLGNDFECLLASDDNPSVLIVIDTFILGKVTEGKERDGQSLMLDVVSTPEVSEKFSSLKGSISPFSVSTLQPDSDKCSNQVYEALKQGDNIFPPYATYERGDTIHSIDTEIHRLWQRSMKEPNNPALAESTIEALRTILLNKQLGIIPKKK